MIFSDRIGTFMRATLPIDYIQYIEGGGRVVYNESGCLSSMINQSNQRPSIIKLDVGISFRSRILRLDICLLLLVVAVC